MASAVRSVAIKPDASVVLIGTLGCEIYELALASKRFTQRVEGHFEHEVSRLNTERGISSYYSVLYARVDVVSAV